MFHVHMLTVRACFILLFVAMTSALAPLEGMDIEERYPNDYVVIFHKDHTLSQHFHNIDRDLSHTPEFKGYSFGYRAIMDDETLDAVRRDEGVRAVDANRPVHAILPVEVVLLQDAAVVERSVSPKQPA